MIGNLKDFLTVVQEGLSNNNSLRQTLQEVQKVTNIFKEKQKSPNECKVNYAAGGDLLEKYQQQWVEIHQNADNNAKSAEAVDTLITEIHEITKHRLRSANEFVQNVTYLPNLTAAVAQCIESLRNVEVLMNAVEEDLVEFEDIVERSNMEKWKLDHHYHLSLYKDKKMAALEEIRCKLAKDNKEQSLTNEKKELAELQVRRQNSAVAFQQDMARYLSVGSMPDPSRSTTPKITLEQVQLEEDRTDLEKFLDS